MAPTDSPLVHQYLWKDHSLPRYQNVIMTVNTFEGILCFSFFAALVAYTQTRSWICIRSVGFRMSRPIQLKLDPNHPDSKERLTQVKAVRALIRRLNPQDNLAMLSAPKMFGIAAIINAAIFFTLGILIPLSLTGYLATAVVQSKFTDTCTGHENSPDRIRYATQLADSYYKRCFISAPETPSCSQDSGIVGSMPQLYEGRDWPCPFAEDVCQNRTQVVQFEFKGLRPRDYGVNLEPRILVDHRVTCAPLKTEKFMFVLPSVDGVPNKTNLLWFGHSPLEGPVKNTGALYGTLLETVNGPNQYSSNFSGNQLVSRLRARPAYDLNVYPIGGNNTVTTAEGLHPTLQKTGGQVFIVVFQAGRTLYSTDKPIDDPFYSAHNKDTATGTYMADYEATALGCLEQFRLCVTGKDHFCSDWGYDVDIIAPLATSDKLPIESRLEAVFIYLYFTGMASIKRLFSIRTDPGMLLTSLTRMHDIVDNINPSEQWITEVHAWFVTAFITARYNFMHIVTRDNVKRAKDTPAAMVKICGIVLFQSSGYTNINFIGLLATVLSLLLICAGSHWRKISRAMKKIVSVIGTGWQLVSFICILLFQPYWSRFWSACHELQPSALFRGKVFLQEAHAWRPELPRVFRGTFWRAFWERRGKLGDFLSGNDWINLPVRNTASSSASR
jgi:hypothetical protein